MMCTLMSRRSQGIFTIIFPRLNTASVRFVFLSSISPDAYLLALTCCMSPTLTAHFYDAPLR
jgi:hypothetical protein